ncbi:MAG: hypothetical protein ACTHON_15080 [Humibacter sp.]
MADTGFSGDPFHEGTAKPMQGLKGDMIGPHTQMPMTSEAMTNPRSAATDNIQGHWNDFEAPTPAPTGSNDKNAAH